MRRSPAEILSTIRGQVVDELAGRRSTVDHVFHELGGEEVRELYETLVGKLQLYLSDGDPANYRAYLRRWVAMRLGSGARHENLIPALIGVGDAVTEVAQDIDGDTDEVRALGRSIMQAGFLAARVVVEVLADEHRRRLRQLDAMTVSEEETRQ